MSQQSLEKPEFKERELTSDEVEMIANEKENIFAPIDPNNKDSWFIHKTDKGKEYEMIKPINAIAKFQNFYTMLLKSTDPNSENHATSLSMDGYSFRKWSDASIYRVKKSNSGSGGGWSSAKKSEYKPKFLKGLLVLDPENASAYIDTHPDENWEYKDYKDGNVVLVSYKT